MRNAGETALRALAAALGFLHGLEVINGKMDGFKVLMPVGGLIPTGIKENKKCTTLSSMFPRWIERVKEKIK